MMEKLQLVDDGSGLMDSTNIQSKHQKHQAFEAELAANKDRVESVVKMGQNLIDRGKCSGSDDAVKTRLESIVERCRQNSPRVHCGTMGGTHSEDF